MSSIDTPKLILAGAAALFLGAAAVGQAPVAPSAPAANAPGAKPSRFKNLKVLPADIPRDQLIATMRGFTQGLGVKCTYCHVGEEGKRETMDFAADTKQAKRTARLMMAMTRTINTQYLGVTDMAKSKVACFTCHRGAEKPLTAPAAMPAPGGAPHAS